MLLTVGLSAQMGSWAINQQDLGRPPQPPFITFLGLVAGQKLATDPSLQLNGPVAEVLYEELRSQATPAGPAGEAIESIRTKYDELGRVIQKDRRAYGPAAKTVSRYEGTRLVSEETSFDSNAQQPNAWNYWKYDEHGKLIDYKRGRGDKLENHETNF